MRRFDSSNFLSKLGGIPSGYNQSLRKVSLWSINSDFLVGNKPEESVNESAINDVIEQVQQELKVQLNEIVLATKNAESRISCFETLSSGIAARLAVLEKKEVAIDYSKFDELEKKVLKMMKD